jgi:hypothetical protein
MRQWQRMRRSGVLLLLYRLAAIESLGVALVTGSEIWLGGCTPKYAAASFLERSPARAINFLAFAYEAEKSLDGSN